MRFIYFFHLLLLMMSPCISLAQKGLTRLEANALAKNELKHKMDAQRSIATKYWQQKEITYGDFQMKFDYRILGKMPNDGRSLYISMHGGGNVPKLMNDRQWKGQLHLYTPKEGIYLAPRAPTDTWNLWHEVHIDTMLSEIIKAAILLENVNPDKVYIMGYSAGGDGTFQLATRMADYWAAGAMMAGHPGDASPLSLRNLAFGMYVGGEDAAYSRNKLVAAWNKSLDSLQKLDTDGYVHETHIYDGVPHWLNRKDSVAIEWLASFKRNPLPRKVVWHQDDKLHTRFYWLGVPLNTAKPHAETIASIKGNIISIEKNDNPTLFIYLNDNLLDLNKEVKLVYNGKVVFNKIVKRTAEEIKISTERLDKHLIFSAHLKIVNGQVI